MQPFAWEGLKRALHSREIRIESLGQMLSLVSTVSLEPEPIPLDVKVVLVGDRLLYYLLQAYDPEFGELFKVAADFEERIDRTAETQRLYARLVATLGAQGSMRPFDRGAVARVVEHGARLAGDAERLPRTCAASRTCCARRTTGRAKPGIAAVDTADVQRGDRRRRSRRPDRLRDRLQEAILRGTLLIDTAGSGQGQVNGLSVIELGNFAFGQPTRITATPASARAKWSTSSAKWSWAARSIPRAC